MTPGFRFVADGTVVRLARMLRFAGYDVRVIPDPLQAYRTALRENRLLLTRNRRRFGHRAGVVVLESENLEDQLVQVLRAFPQEIRPGLRCMECNALLQRISPSEARGRIPLYVYLTQKVFHRCPRCGRITWPGTHVTRMTALLHRALHIALRSESGSPS